MYATIRASPDWRAPPAPALQQQVKIADRLLRPGQIFASDLVMKPAADRMQHRTMAQVDAERAGAVGEHQLAALGGPHHHRTGARRCDGRGYRRDRQTPASLLSPPLNQQLKQSRHQMLVLHDHGECVAIMLAMQGQHLIDHARFGGRHSRSMRIVVSGA
jgi:hypothetical protein